MARLANLLVVLAAFLVSGCWLSVEPLFGPEDNAAVNLAGPYRYTVTRGETADIESLLFEPQPDDSVQAIVTYAVDEASAALIKGPLEAGSRLHFIAIPGAPEGWYLLNGSSEDGERDKSYMIASLDEERVLRIYAPDCRGTPPRAGLDICTNAPNGAMICNFQTRDALLGAAREAAELLARPSLVWIGPWTELSPVYDWESDPAMTGDD